MRRLALSGVLLATCLAAGPAGAGPEYKVTATDLARLEPRMQRQVASLQYLMNPYQLRQFFRLTGDDARLQWIQRFWAAQDPTPTTPKNEMKIEHYLRADIARADFARAQWPGWDTRGEVLIRYGFPDYRGKIEAEVTARKVHAPGELWYYRRHQMIVQFRDESLQGHYTYALTPLGDAQDISSELAEFLIYDTKESIQEQIPPQYLDFYRDAEVNETGVEWGPVREALIGLEPQRFLRPRLGGTTEGMDEIVDPDWARSLPDNPAVVFDRDQVKELASNFEGVLEDTPSSYPFNFAKTAFPFYFGVEQFRGGEGVIRAEVNLEFLVKPVEGAAERTYVADVTVFDEGYRVVDQQTRELKLPLSVSSAARLVPAQIVFSLPRRYYRVAVSMEDRDQKLSSAYKTTLSTRNFDHELAISDVLFAQKIAAVETTSPFARGALEVIPHPIRRYAVGSPVPVYFEVYNLGLDQGGVTDYEVEYRVVPHSPEKRGALDRFRDEPTVFASRFKGSGYSANQPLHLTIQSANLKPGLYDFMVRIKDEYWQSIELRQATFRIVEPSEKQDED
jgi:GWxTD domain-containing protein